MKSLIPARRLYPVLRAVTVALGMFIVTLSLLPNPPGASTGGVLGGFLSELLFGSSRYGDKVMHFLAYGLLALLAEVAFGRHRREALVVLAILFLLGAALEILQMWGGVRTGDLLDLLANTLGIGVGGTVGVFARLFVRRQGWSPQ